MYNAVVIASHFINKGIEEGPAITPMQLNKLVFLAHGWFMAFTDKPLINEAVEAWQHGPVVASIYHSFKLFKGSPITRVNLAHARMKEEYKLIAEDENAVRVLDSVWRGFGQKSGLELSALTHLEGSPWHTIWEERGGKHQQNAIIPNLLIKAYYRDIYEKRLQKNG